MSEGRFPSYHHLPPAAPAPQRHHLATAATPSVPHPLTFHPPAISHQLSSWFTKQDMAAYRNTPYASLHNVAALQMHKPQHTPVIDRWMDSRNNMPPPSRPGPPSPSPAHSANVSPSFSLSRTVEFDLTKHKKESEQLSIDLSSNNKKYESFSYKREKDQVNGQIKSTKIGAIEEKAISVIAPNPHKVIKSEVRCNIPDSKNIQNVKSANTEGYENKFSKQDNKIAWDVVDTPIKIEVEDTNNVEKMLENMFQTNESEKQSVIKIVKPIKSPSPSMMRAESVEKILKSPSPIPKIENDKSEDSIQSENSSKKIHDTHSQFLEVENKLEELFGGVITSTSTSDQQIMTENKSKPIISTKRPYNKNKKQLKKVKKILPVAEKLKPVVEPPIKKYKGPVVRINGGNIENPTSFVLINRNVHDDEDSLDGRNINRKTFSYKSGGCNGEEKPDVNNLESSDWKCVFCSQGPNVRHIGQDPSGDLFGPYYVSIPKDVKSNDNPKRKKSKHNLNDNDSSETYIEVWTHENCLVWASGVYMVGDKIIGLEDSVRDAKNNSCSYCGVNGASIGCVARHCRSRAHYNCAVRFGWLLDSQNHMTTCYQHRNSPLGSSCH
ncbi:protein BREAST CANCER SUSCEPTIBILITY 1 isoform X1 [Aphis craccivora]|uniref:Protein BREAST CANCER SUSCEPTIBILITY 1 isoform X1 n=1 Tax=Aphis craccivora TaxID=307492 RepID=A0A6G0YXC8_APHCR|nr:protein BREAST CANCER SUSCEPTIBILITY 1 isoform X1 [Aphis craccivora]